MILDKTTERNWVHCVQEILNWMLYLNVTIFRFGTLLLGCL